MYTYYKYIYIYIYIFRETPPQAVIINLRVSKTGRWIITASEGVSAIARSA